MGLWMPLWEETPDTVTEAAEGRGAGGELSEGRRSFPTMPLWAFSVLN